MPVTHDDHIAGSEEKCEWRYRWDMADLKFQLPATESVDVDGATSAAVNRGVTDADAGRTVSLDEVRQLIPKWISKFESQKPR